MPSNLTKLQSVEKELINLYASAVTGEPYHPDYESNPKVFRSLVRSDMLTEKGMRQYFAQLAPTVADRVNWHEFELRKASDLLPFNLEEEIKKVAGILSGSLVYSLVAGGNFTEEEFNTDIGWNESNHPAIEFLRKYTVKLAGNLNKTTLDRVNQSIRMSIDTGEDKLAAIQRLISVIDDPKRAAVIAHTESVRAFSQGRLEVGRQIGVTQKEWDATYNRCPICGSLSGKVVAIDKDFPGGYDAPPAHPNCRCLLRLKMGK